jgi:hypothetical protein
MKVMANTSEFGRLLDLVANDPSPALQAAFIAWARANLPNRGAPSQGDVVAAGGYSAGQAGRKVDYLVKCYRSREDTAATYADAMAHILSKPENAALKVAFSKETGRGGRIE